MEITEVTEGELQGLYTWVRAHSSLVIVLCS